MSTKRTAVVIIDPQDDFMDKAGAALPVPGAMKDMERLAHFIVREGANIDAIIVTKDTHVEDHIAHPLRWLTAQGTHPAPYTSITIEDVAEGRFRAAQQHEHAWQLAYLHLLKQAGGKDLMIWPPHCLVGTEGHKVTTVLMKALAQWMERSGNTVTFVEKGRNRDTEQYGAFAADVQVKHDASTYFNATLVERIRSYDRQIWAGEALSHCVMASFEQAYREAGDEAREERIILTDAMSPVTGFEKMAEDWLHIKRAEGVRLSITASLVL